MVIKVLSTHLLLVIIIRTYILKFIYLGIKIHSIKQDILIACCAS